MGRAENAFDDEERIWVFRFCCRYLSFPLLFVIPNMSIDECKDFDEDFIKQEDIFFTENLLTITENYLDEET